VNSLARFHPGAGIDAEIRRRDDALPIERRGNAFCSLATGGKETRRHENENERAERHGVAQGQSR
jgi:hypothetical protein